MKLRRIALDGRTCIEFLAPQGWVRLTDVLERVAPHSGKLPAAAHDPLTAIAADDMIALLSAPDAVRAHLAEAAVDIAPVPERAPTLLPFEPRSFRDFMLYEAHAIAAARGFVNRFMPAAARFVSAYEGLTRRTFPKLKPHPLWYRQPVYYMGNHLAIVSDGDDIAVPPYTSALDYELELGFVIVRPLYNDTPAVCEAAIGGFVVLNDFSARDVQLDEMASGFGPQKAKHFASAISAVVVSADEILPRWRALKGSVRVNGELLAEPLTAGARWSLGEVLAHACRGERLYPGELFATGTLPGGSGIETGRLLNAGDTVEIAIDAIATLANRIV